MEFLQKKQTSVLSILLTGWTVLPLCPGNKFLRTRMHYRIGYSLLKKIILLEYRILFPIEKSTGTSYCTGYLFMGTGQWGKDE